ncbi:acyltransferase [Legionella santicrucis]|uniref:Acyltransferase n=1 Tax=Legionella santicrucis TaxID=45074 RepID=A0A0W0Z3K8_9GAMM|nr:acyltransferase [Legionella santicrucis]KTD63701.1 acyltransferase [Legionella santicrucis]
MARVMLSDFENSRTNNFTVLRLILAWIVLMGHSFPICGKGSDFISLLIMPYAWIGSISVSLFFAISGYLVTASFIKRGIFTYLTSRIFRLYPCVIMYSFIMILVIGPLSTDIPILDYFQAHPWPYLLNSYLWEWNYNLPYVFNSNPLSTTNGSAWTLPVELRCYVLVAFLGLLGSFNRRIKANIILLIVLFIIKFHFSYLLIFSELTRAEEPLTYFILGSLFWVNRHLIPLNWFIATIGFFCLFLGVKLNIYPFIAPPIITYLLFMLVYKTPHLNADKFGDISYGIYIYAWPIQQMVWAPGQSAYMNIVFSTIIVVPLAYISWWYIEAPSLKLRYTLAEKIKTFKLLGANFIFNKELSPNLSFSERNFKLQTLDRKLLTFFCISFIMIAYTYSVYSINLKRPSITPYYLTDQNWLNGINRNVAGFFVRNSPLNMELYKIGKLVKFSDGVSREIIQVGGTATYLNIFLSGAPLDGKKVGFPHKIEVV